MSYYVIGDLHGHLNDFRRLLANCGLIDGADNWQGATHQLWLIGDLFDRGRYGVQCVDLAMKLQKQARQVGGEVNGILGNHEMMILCAHRFGDRLTRGGITVIDQWQRWGGNNNDLARLQSHHIDWLKNLPAMQKLGNKLLVHADAMFYLEIGRTVAAVNQHLLNLLDADDLAGWERTLRVFAEHQAFSGQAIIGHQKARKILSCYGADQLIHGHTPIPIARGVSPAMVSGAWEYCEGACVNVDGGIYMGGPGFIYEIAD